MDSSSSTTSVVPVSDRQDTAASLSDPRAGPGDVDRRRRLRAVVREIRDSKLSAARRETHFRGKYGDLFEECPTLMSAALRPDFDARMLDVMLGILDRDGEGQATEEKVGQILVDRFVKPALGSGGGASSGPSSSGKGKRRG
jgi:hypothetical protein